VALGALYGTPVTSANAALTGNLLLSAVGVLMGGLLVGRTTRHGMVATFGLGAMAVFTALIAQIDLGTIALIGAMSLTGFFSFISFSLGGITFLTSGLLIFFLRRLTP